ncbi:1-hydroxy-2-methyl-2-butenyl 4-diphosphate reductase [Streptomyces sp. NPDC000594]|uniref:phosphorylase family protein n=1 Tax=Streptomyces sp. NPDC000594 TaxID=3154261 RepID=UPI00332ECDB9
MPTAPVPPSGPPGPCGPDGGPPLLIACALTVERLALRGAARGPAALAGPVTLVRTGMGPERAGRAVRSALAPGPPAGTAVLAAGFCAGLVPGMRPGDVVVADTVRHPAGTIRCTAPALLAAAVARAVPGRRVHTGPLTAADHVVRGAERALLRTTGAIGVDMESAATLRAALGTGPRPVAAVRVVVDAPGHELIRPGTVRGGLSAFRVLRAVLPAFQEWHLSLPLPRR